MSDKDYLGVRPEDWDAVAEAFSQLKVDADEFAEVVGRVMLPFAEWWVSIQPILGELHDEMAEILSTLEDEKEMARQRSRDDLARKRRRMRGRGRHILPPGN